LLLAFLIVDFGRPGAIIDFGLLARRSFGAGVLLNVFFRIGLLETGYVLPQFLGQIQAYRPLQIGDVLMTTSLTQLVAFPASYWLIRIVAPRLPVFLGLALFASGAALDSFSTSLSAADQFLASQGHRQLKLDALAEEQHSSAPAGQNADRLLQRRSPRRKIARFRSVSA
jgi:DHA2 family multidrug resistance protein